MYTQQNNTDRLHNIQELAGRLGIGVQRAYKLAREGEFDDFVVRLGERQYRFRPDGLSEYIQRGGKRRQVVSE